MSLARQIPRHPDQAQFGLAALAAVLASSAAATIATMSSAKLALILLLGPVAFFFLVSGFMRAPHIAVSGSIVFLVVLPAAKIFVAGWLGGVKEVLLLAALTAAFLATLRARAQGRGGHSDRILVLLITGFLLVLTLNVSGSHNIAWSNSLRLTATPLLWMLLGHSLDGAEKTFRWACRALVVASCIAALVGLAQQVIGGPGLADLGYRWNVDLRTVGGHLRSFGTLDEPFQYTAVLLLAVGVLMNSKHFGALRWPMMALLLAGTAVSFVRTAAVIVLALYVLLALRYRRPVLAGVMVVVTAASLLFVLGPSSRQPIEPRALQDRTATLATLNGRATVWAQAIGSPSGLIVGRGVGTFASQILPPNATAAQAAATSTDTSHQTYADSSYIATLASAGIASLVLLVALLIRLGALVRSSVRLAAPIGWILAATLLVLLVDATTRDSLWGVPNATIGFLLIGLGLRAASDQGRGAAV